MKRIMSVLTWVWNLIISMKDGTIRSKDKMVSTMADLSEKVTEIRESFKQPSQRIIAEHNNRKRTKGRSRIQRCGDRFIYHR